MYFNLQNQAVNLLKRITLALTLAATCGMASATVIHVSLDTSAFGVTSGYLDMNLSASSNVPLATATVTNLTGFDSNPYMESWGVTTVPGGYKFRNDTANDLFQSVHFGSTLSFDLTFDGAYDAATSYISAFTVSAFGDDFSVLGATDPLTGALATFLWTPSLTDGGNGSLAALTSDGGVGVVPEPAGLALMGLGLGALVLVLRRRGRATATGGSGRSELAALAG
ncbi:PEP-CTERM sorting domain-containing protein [Duganella sp. FT92W]|uniref:PEP-CTERM sorting domain-containing protein n=1 Tax=Pseudoduganella rivuli TaxID=2666085 RepID=A0A7X2IIW4_9BURK|nr:NF038129 family PEP-CTERM protein [Pseudoduganella rivuli]MRV70298.1 PEP-CTERM sorting domain-containing protein [Pseudoduganella rivuli]